MTRWAWRQLATDALNAVRAWERDHRCGDCLPQGTLQHLDRTLTALRERQVRLEVEDRTIYGMVRRGAHGDEPARVDIALAPMTTTEVLERQRAWRPGHVTWVGAGGVWWFVDEAEIAARQDWMHAAGMV